MHTIRRFLPLSLLLAGTGFFLVITGCQGLGLGLFSGSANFKSPPRELMRPAVVIPEANLRAANAQEAALNRITAQNNYPYKQEAARLAQLQSWVKQQLGSSLADDGPPEELMESPDDLTKIRAAYEQSNSAVLLSQVYIRQAEVSRRFADLQKWVREHSQGLP